MNYKIPLAFVLIYFIWGSTFTAIKYGLDAFPPFLLAGLRFTLAGSVFFLASRWKDFRTMSASEYAKNMQVGFLLTLGNGGVCWAEQFISSGVAALIVGSLPVMFMLVNWLSFEKKSPHPSSIFAFVIGLSGIALISLDDASATDWRVILGLIIANVCWVTGSLLFRMSKSDLGYYPRATVQTIFGGLSLVGFSFLFQERSVNFSEITGLGYFSVVYLAMFGTVLAYTAYSYLLKNVRTELTSTYALINPLIALILGMIFLDEVFTVKIALSAALIILSVVLVLYGKKINIRRIRNL